MKTQIKPIYFIILLVALFTACTKDDNSNTPEYPQITSMDELSVSDAFSWSLTENTAFTFRALDNLDQPIPGVRFDVYSMFETGEEMMFSGITTHEGIFISEHPISNLIDEVVVRTKHIGLTDEVILPVNGASVSFTFGGRQVNTKESSGEATVYNTAFAYLGTYNGQGVPNYLEPVNDPIPAGLLQNINNALPEGFAVPQHHPEFLASANETNLLLTEDADIWVTFVSEGSVRKNVLGFYTYNYDDPPYSPEEIDTITIIFPNVSFTGSGGGLHAGNKVHIGNFPANTVIGWVLIHNGWVGGQVSSSATRFYSDSEFNPESDPDKQQHNVLLYDSEYDLILIGFEDIMRNSAGDNDFNDAIFYATASPGTAIDIQYLPEVDPDTTDSDGDGVYDSADDYPNDPNKAFDHYYPSRTTKGTLSFEDKWPSKGDYDFNDLVIDYRFNQITNASNQVVQIEAQLEVVAIGAGYRNGFGFSLPLAPSDVASVTGMNLQHNIVTLSANGTEAGQAYATVIAFDNAFNLFENNQVRYINTDMTKPAEPAQTINISITLANPVALVGFGPPPYNPFLIVNLERGKEIHLPDNAPSSLADAALFSTEDDDSDPSSGIYYKTVKNLPWVMHTPSPFDYLVEKKPVIQGHLVFSTWAMSNGTLYKDWYLNRPGYRNAANIFTMIQ